MKTLFTVIALGSVAFVSADAYGRPDGYRSGNCPSCNGGGYYQDQSSPYDGGNYQGQPDNGYYNDPYSQQNPTYSQNQPYGQDQNYGQNQPYGQYNQPYGQNQNYGQNQQYSQQQQQKMNSRGKYANQNSRNQKGISDQEITTRIRNTLSSGWFSKGFQDVSFTVNNGNVNLSGSVDTLENKNKVEDSIRKIDGVRNVNNQITIGKGNSKTYSASELQNSETKYPQDFASTSHDKQLNATIRNKLSNGWFSNGNETLVIKTSDGIVVISGIADKPEDIQKINDSIKNIEGVRSVNNQMTVKNK